MDALTCYTDTLYFQKHLLCGHACFPVRPFCVRTNGKVLIRLGIPTAGLPQ